MSAGLSLKTPMNTGIQADFLQVSFQTEAKY